MIASEIPPHHADAPWLKNLLGIIQDQAKLIQAQAEEIQKLRGTVKELQDELARVKKTPKRPKFRPKGQTQEPKNGGVKEANAAEPSGTAPKVQQEIVIPAENVPAGSRRKGYALYQVQDLEIAIKLITYKLEIWETPDGRRIQASLPSDAAGGHFGAELRTFIHGLYASGVTEPEIFKTLRALGIEISEGQVHNLIASAARAMAAISQEILTAGLESAPFIRVDDTGAKHAHQNHVCTHVGGEHFAFFKTTESKSRHNFLTILGQGRAGWAVNDAAIWHLCVSGISDEILHIFEECKGRVYRTLRGLQRLFKMLGLSGKKVLQRCEEACRIGFIEQTCLKHGQVLLSDRAGQFAVLNHAACWIHMERPLRTLIASTSEVEAEITQVRQSIWALYAQVKHAIASGEGHELVNQAYDDLIATKVISDGVQKVLQDFKTYRNELLKALDYPKVPLHNNDSERDIRGLAKIRKVSGSTKSEAGLLYRDALLSLKQTCFRLKINFWEFLRSWFKRRPLDLPSMIRSRYHNHPTPAT